MENAAVSGGNVPTAQPPGAAPFPPYAYTARPVGTLSPPPHSNISALHVTSFAPFVLFSRPCSNIRVLWTARVHRRWCDRAQSTARRHASTSPRRPHARRGRCSARHWYVLVFHTFSGALFHSLRHRSCCAVLHCVMCRTGRRAGRTCVGGAAASERSEVCEGVRPHRHRLHRAVGGVFAIPFCGAAFPCRWVLGSQDVQSLPTHNLFSVSYAAGKIV